MQTQTRQQILSAQIRQQTRNQTPHADAPAAEAIRHVHRERDFGVGYGNSSGYASDRCYTRNWGQERFTCG